MTESISSGSLSSICKFIEANLNYFEALMPLIDA